MPPSSPARLAQFHDGADELAGRNDGGLHDGLVDGTDLALRPVRRIGDDDLGAILFEHSVDDVGRGGDQVQIELALQTLAGDLHVQQTQEATPEPETQRHRCFRLIGQRRVVEPQLVQGIAQIGVVRTVDGIQPRVDHRLGLAVAGQRLLGAVADRRHGVADLDWRTS